MFSRACWLVAVASSFVASAEARAQAPECPTGTTEKVPDGLAASDWSSIRAAYEAGRHAAYEVEDGYRARNPGQQWVTHFDGRGFTVTPDDGGWSWGLDLLSYGFAGAERAVDGDACTEVEGARVSYSWDAALEEWYENDGRGLEHGYTARERPDGQGPLTLTLAIREGLRPEVQVDGRGVRFLNEAGEAVVNYSGLRVFDADRRDLAARFEVVASELRIVVQEEGARYPLTIDPIAQQAYLKASNTGIGDWFGESVSVSANTVVVGAQFEDSNATGVNGDQSDNSAGASGAAYVFVRNPTTSTWSQQAYLKASNTGSDDRFGVSVSASLDTVVVGAISEDSFSTGVNEDQTNNFATNSGAAYVFVRNPTTSTWSQQAYLKASNTEALDYFGYSVSVSVDTVIVTAGGEDSNATGVNGDQSNNSAGLSGAAYVFVRNGTIWSQQAYLKASNTGMADEFGSSVSVSGDTAVVGAAGEDSSATGVNGDQNNDSAPTSGAAYVFVTDGTTWSQQAYLKASNTEGNIVEGDKFGWFVSASGDTVAVGAPFEDSNATGVNGDQSNNGAIDSGAAYVFVWNGTTWSQQAYLKASNTEALDYFGYSVSVSVDTVAVGAPLEDSNATGVNGDQSDNSADGAGAVYVFGWNGTMWSQQAYLKASNTGAFDLFGVQVSVLGDTVVVGAPWEDSSATGVNGDQSNNSSGDSGAAYVFDLAAAEPISAICFGDGSDAPCGCGNEATPGSGGGCANGAPMPAGQGAVLSASGTSSIAADDLVLTADFTTNQPGLFFQGNNAIGGGTGVTFGDGVRCCGGSVVRLEIADPPGTAGPKTTSSTQPILGTSPPGTTTPGDTRCYQWWYRNPGTSMCSFNFNLSNAVVVTWTL